MIAAQPCVEARCRVVLVAGARPNFMKIAPIVREFAREPAVFSSTIVHTGQHYDTEMSAVFFEQLGIPRPDINLQVGSGSHARQTAAVMTGFEDVLLKARPDVVLVVGDVNSTLACALVAAKLGVPVAHVEAGLRSFDRSMPEEINRVLTDQISDWLFVTEPAAEVNLVREGIDPARVHFVGNVMIDTLLSCRDRARQLRIPDALGLGNSPYAVLTLHRPHNVDQRDVFEQIMQGLEHVSRDVVIVFPMHPRTRQTLLGSQGAAALRRFGTAASGQAARVSRVSRVDRSKSSRAHGLRRRPGGNHRSWRAVSHLATEYGTASHGERRDQPDCRHVGSSDH